MAKAFTDSELSALPADVLAARNFAIAYHGDQTYGDGPYVGHLDDVVRCLADHRAHVPTLIAGYLHDVIEDTSATVTTVEVAFGRGVATMVWALTVPDKSTGVTKAARYQQAYDNIASVGPWALEVKLADRLSHFIECGRLYQDGRGPEAERYLPWYREDTPRLLATASKIADKPSRADSMAKAVKLMLNISQDFQGMIDARLAAAWAR